MRGCESNWLAVAAALLVTPSLPSQELPRVTELLEDRTNVEVCPDVLVVVAEDRVVLRHAGGDALPEPLPLVEASRVAFAHVLRNVAAAREVALEKPVAEGHPELLALGSPFDQWGWVDALRADSWQAFGAHRFLSEGEAGRSTEEFLRTHAIPAGRAISHARYRDREAWNGYAARSHLPVAIAQRAIELRSGESFAGWLEDAASQAGLPSLRVGGAPIEGLPDAEIDASFDLRLSLDDVEALLRGLAAADSSLPSGLERSQDYLDGEAWVSRSGGFRPGAIRCEVARMSPHGVAWFAWSASPEFRGDAIEQALLEEFAGGSEPSLTLGGGMGWGRGPKPRSRDGTFRGTIPSVAPAPIELELAWRRGGIMVRVLPDGPRVSIGRALDVRPGQLTLSDGTELALLLEPVDDGYEGIAIVEVPGRSKLPYRFDLSDAQ